MIRQMIKIDTEKCNGCGLCVSACHEGAIGMENEKAVLLREDYCDGLGNCLPACPTGAISFEEREAPAYNHQEVQRNSNKPEQAAPPLPCGCPGTQARALRQDSPAQQETEAFSPTEAPATALRQWPIQIKLVPANAAYLDGAHLLVAADCAAYAYGNFHQKFMRNRITLIGCPKLDEGDYAEKLATILQSNDIQSVTVARMEVPCCGGIEDAVKRALRQSGKQIPWRIVTLSTEGQVLSDM